MKTLGQVLDEIDRLRPNGYEPEEKTEWLNELAARIQTFTLSVGVHRRRSFETRGRAT